MAISSKTYLLTTHRHFPVHVICAAQTTSLHNLRIIYDVSSSDKGFTQALPVPYRSSSLHHLSPFRRKIRFTSQLEWEPQSSKWLQFWPDIWQHWD